MDRESHFKWELTREELDTIWWALRDRDDAMRKKAELVRGKEHQLVSEQEYLSMAGKCSSLIAQINRMRNRYW